MKKSRQFAASVRKCAICPRNDRRICGERTIRFCQSVDWVPGISDGLCHFPCGICGSHSQTYNATSVIYRSSPDNGADAPTLWYLHIIEHIPAINMSKKCFACGASIPDMFSTIEHFIGNADEQRDHLMAFLMASGGDGR